MSERYTNQGEFAKNAETLEQAGIEARAELEKTLESNQERRRETSAETERATQEALELAQESQRSTAEQAPVNPPETITDRRPSKREIDARYRATLQHVQSQLSRPSRTFSRVIHNPVVEKTSEVVGRTVARPNLIIAGAIGAIASIIVYMLAKRYGYALSGSETILLFLGGWLIGGIIEYARVGFTNRRS